MKKKSIILASHGYKVNGPKVDKSFTLSFDIGEYVIPQLVALMQEFGPDEVLLIEVTRYTGKEGKWIKPPKKEKKVKSEVAVQ